MGGPLLISRVRNQWESRVTRADWQQIAEEQLLAAQALLAAQCWASAYYLAGYAAECGLKSCVLVRLAMSPDLMCSMETPK